MLACARILLPDMPANPHLFIPSSPEVADHEIGLHCSSVTNAGKVFLFAFPKIGRCFPLMPSPCLLHFEPVHDLLAAHACRLVLPSRIKIIAVLLVVCKTGELPFGNESGFLLEELPVCHLATARNNLPPLPRALFHIPLSTLQYYCGVEIKGESHLPSSYLY